MSQELALLEFCSSWLMLDFDYDFQRVLVSVQQEQGRKKRSANQRLIGQRVYRIEQAGGIVGYLGLCAMKHVKFISRPRHEDKRLHDVVRLKGLQHQVHAIGSIQ